MPDIRLIHGDCLVTMASLPSGSVDAIVCDLPYTSTEIHWDKLIPMEPLWREYWRICKQNAPVILTAQQPFATDLINSERKYFRYETIWHKTMPMGMPNANKMPLKIHENILVFYRKLPTYNPQKSKGKPYYRAAHARGEVYGHSRLKDKETINTGDRFPQSVIRIANSNHKSLHPTQKPIALLEYLIRTYTNEGETVLDNCFGSCSTGVACINTNRNFIGIEKDEGFYCVGARRIADAQAKAALEIETA